jgi:DNA-binding transcriptional LysR family regulator
MAPLNLNWLNIFVAIYKLQNVSRAAQSLGMEQASASIVLGKLRKHFNDPLFCRSAAGMVPTPRAMAIYPDVIEAVFRLEKASGAAQSFVPAQAAQAFRLCMTDISEIVLLPRLINHLQQDAPGIVIEAEKISTDSRHRLESGNLDLALGFMPDLEAGVYQQALFAQDFVCLAASDHPRIQSTLSRSDFASEGHIIVTSSGTGHSIVDKVLHQQALARRVVLRVQSFLGVARIVAQTELLVIVPRQLGKALAQQERVQVLEPPIALPHYKVKQHWHERLNADAGNQWLRQSIMGLFSGLSDGV